MEPRTPTVSSKLMARITIAASCREYDRERFTDSELLESIFKEAAECREEYENE